jgi:hypothetical protein
VFILGPHMLQHVARVHVAELRANRLQVVRRHALEFQERLAGAVTHPPHAVTHQPQHRLDVAQGAQPPIRDGKALAHVGIARLRVTRKLREQARLDHHEQRGRRDLHVVRVPSQQLHRDLAAEDGIHVRQPRQQRRDLGRRERKHQRADRLARDVRARVDEQARHRLSRPAFAFGELVHDAGHRPLRVDADEGGRRIERHEGVRRGELRLQRLPRGRVAQVAERADPEDPPADMARMKEAPRSDLESERQRDGVQALGRLAAHGVLQRIPLFHEVRQLTAGEARQRRRLVTFQRGTCQERPPGGDHTLVEACLETVVTPHQQR